MSAAEPTPFPWPGVPRLDREAVRARRELAERVAAALDLGRVPAALRDLLGDDVELSGGALAECRRAESLAPAAPDWMRLQFPGHALRLSVRPEAELLRVVVARLLDQDFQLGWADSGVDAALRGAGTALVLEVVRRAARGEAPELLCQEPPPAGWALWADVSLRLGGRPYRLELCADSVDGLAPCPRPRAPADLERLGSMRLSIPWVGAFSGMPASALAALSVGDVWLPGAGGWWAGEPPLSAGLLLPARSRRGIPVRVSGGRTVVGAEVVAVPEELEGSMSQEDSELEQVVGEVPLVIRLELGALELSAAEWAALRPGDVLSSGLRVDEPVILRAGSHEVARGQLVEIQGEIGVRITRVGLAKAP